MTINEELIALLSQNKGRVFIALNDGHMTNISVPHINHILRLLNDEQNIVVKDAEELFNEDNDEEVTDEI